jgi:hypothetical protein
VYPSANNKSKNLLGHRVHNRVISLICESYRMQIRKKWLILLVIPINLLKSLHPVVHRYCTVYTAVQNLKASAVNIILQHAEMKGSDGLSALHCREKE